MVATRRIQLVFPGHDYGELAHRPQVLPPSLGLLTLAAYVKARVPDCSIDVFDGNATCEDDILQCLDAPLIGFGTWFSNFDSTLRYAEKLKSVQPGTQIVIGGPHTTGIAERILQHNPFIDFVVSGDGEEALVDLVKGKDPASIPNLAYRDVSGAISVASARNVDLHTVPSITLESLVTPYTWDADASIPVLAAFPVSGMRGCFQTKRCEYCSIPTLGLREKDPSAFWTEIRQLHDTSGIDYFFETGDTFTPAYARRLASVSPPADTRLRIYSYPGLITKENLSIFSDLGIVNIFIGVESVLVFKGKGLRSYKKGYTVESLHAEIELLAQQGITVMPSFIFGLPGETDRTLEENYDLVCSIADHPAVTDSLVNVPLPLPGSAYFDTCMRDPTITAQYREITGHDLTSTDRIDYYRLSRLFVERFTTVRYDDIVASIERIQKKYDPKFGHWGHASPNIR